MPDSDPIDIAARALCRSHSDTDEEAEQWWADQEVSRYNFLLDAQRMIAALEASGIRLVRREATEEMVKNWPNGPLIASRKAVWANMWDAAPVFGTLPSEKK